MSRIQYKEDTTAWIIHTHTHVCVCRYLALEGLNNDIYKTEQVKHFYCWKSQTLRPKYTLETRLQHLQLGGWSSWWIGRDDPFLKLVVPIWWLLMDAAAHCWINTKFILHILVGHKISGAQHFFACKALKLHLFVSVLC